MKRVCRVYDLTKSGLIRYPQSLKYQRALVDDIYERRNDTSHNFSASDALLLLEHSDVYTLGRGATIDNIKFLQKEKEDDNGEARAACNPEVYRVSRGGEVTWHGPGQLVAYPLINLANPWHKKDLRWYVYQLEETIIQTLDKIGMKGERSPINPGVWVGQEKVAAVGIGASRWITMHGVSLNISCDLSMYKNIIPCGIMPEVGGVSSINKLLGSVGNNEHNVENIKNHFLDSFSVVFGIELSYVGFNDKKYNLENIVNKHQTGFENDLYDP